ncbi:extracellular solute-binding protein [Microbacterium sp. p3-SID336]|uniref:extracellular solute-binding protein n=1 Tax=Microbacterium sp. p3-SID336 TaxID=2916212 RepID=UPI0021A2BC1E|nr:extracellular solute-binding protein [Microbacterium sp. p3-SID336]MCT1476876.1 extracellular solute-binding protein [Microbacterium sp. p3-SID336]
MVTYGKRRLIAAFALTTVGAVVLAGCSGGSEPETEESSGPVTLTLTTNSITGGKNAAEADWIADWVVPEFEKAMKEDGKDVTVEFQPQGVDDEDYKTKIALDLQSGKGADIIGMDGIWVGEFAEAGYIKPLAEVGGDAVDDWDGWAQIPDAVQSALSFDGDRYGVPQGADGRVLYYNKDLFAQAGLDEEWAPESWDDILDAAKDLKQLDGVTPIQLNAGTAMGEATTMQGLLPMLVGTGEQVYEDDKWVGATDGMKEVLDLYKTIYVDEGLGDPVLQQEASGRDTSFQLFAEGKIGILLEGDYFWRSVINPAEGVGTAPMADRDEVVGYAKIPAIEPGEGIKDQDYVSMSGGTGRVLNPNSKNPELAWELLAFMNSPEAYEARAAGTLAISPRDDVNEKLLSSDPMLTFVSQEVLPITAYRPGLAAYPQVSVLLQQATLDVATGTSVDDALQTYVRGLEGVVGPDAISE